MAKRFFDEDTGFELEIHFEPIFDNIDAVIDEQKEKIDKALALFKRMENGEIVNHTEVKAESEDRFVDHYNHRLEEELVRGRSLRHTLDIWDDTVAFAEKVLKGEIKPSGAPRYETIIFNGIGGSYLGPLMMIVAKYGIDYNITANLPMKILFISNTDPEHFNSILKHENIETTIMVHLSKSGSTSETAGNMQSFVELCKQANLPVGEHNCCVTIENSNLDKVADENKFLKVWHMELETGGRTSVCSAIGMVPSAFARLDFAQFIKGMSCMDKMTRRSENNPAALIASLIDKSNQKLGFRNMIILCYSEYLKEYAHYLQQLYMESLGKEYKVDGTPAHVGQTVFGGVGTGEQHSFMQQIQKGLADCFVRLFYFRHRKEDLPNKAAGSVGRQLLAFLKGTEKALIKNKRPFMTSTFDERNEFNIGMMIALEERIVSFLASFYDINAYDQPGVQDGKLAASDVNKFSALVVEKLLQLTGEVEGNSEEIIKKLGVDVLPYEAEAILTDIVANHAVKGAYPGLESIKATRKWNPKAENFTFTFSK